jgi:hypothetical protein
VVRLILIAAALAWSGICAGALVKALRTGVMPGRVSPIDRDQQPGPFAFGLAGILMAFMAGVVVVVWATRTLG